MQFKVLGVNSSYLRNAFGQLQKEDVLQLYPYERNRFQIVLVQPTTLLATCQIKRGDTDKRDDMEVHRRDKLFNPFGMQHLQKCSLFISFLSSSVSIVRNGEGIIIYEYSRL